jgi:SAM-dependent methyltransferase
MPSMVERIDRALYPGVKSNWDDDLLRQSILEHLRPDSNILDLGAGAGILPQMNFRGRAARVCGVDLDPRVLDNPMLDEAKIADGASIPYGNAMFDVVFADNVLEHLAEPLIVFREVKRVLKPGGIFIFKTPNKQHYMPAISRMTPHSFHRFYNRKRGRAGEDTFPTHYRANTRRDIKNLAAGAGLTIKNLSLIEGRPEYLRLSAVTYLAGAAYERLVNASSGLARFRIVLIGTLSKSPL